jgi:hypothetical protein
VGEREEGSARSLEVLTDKDDDDDDDGATVQRDEEDRDDQWEVSRTCPFPLCLLFVNFSF